MGLRVNYPLFLSDLNETWILSTYFRNTQISNFMKNHSVGAEFIYAGGRTDRQTWRSQWSLFAILLKRLKIARYIRFPRCISIYYLDSSEDLSAVYSTSNSLVSLLVLLKIRDEDGNIERSFAVIVQIRSIANSLGNTSDAWPVWVVRLPFFFGGGR